MCITHFSMSVNMFCVYKRCNKYRIKKKTENVMINMSRAFLLITTTYVFNINSTSIITVMIIMTIISITIITFPSLSSPASLSSELRNYHHLH